MALHCGNRYFVRNHHPAIEPSQQLAQPSCLAVGSDLNPFSKRQQTAYVHQQQEAAAFQLKLDMTGQTVETLAAVDGSAALCCVCLHSRIIITWIYSSRARRRISCGTQKQYSILGMHRMHALLSVCTQEHQGQRGRREIERRSWAERQWRCFRKVEKLNFRQSFRHLHVVTTQHCRNC